MAQAVVPVINELDREEECRDPPPAVERNVEQAMAEEPGRGRGETAEFERADQLVSEADAERGEALAPAVAAPAQSQASDGLDRDERQENRCRVDEVVN